MKRGMKLGVNKNLMMQQRKMVKKNLQLFPRQLIKEKSNKDGQNDLKAYNVLIHKCYKVLNFAHECSSSLIPWECDEEVYPSNFFEVIWDCWLKLV